MMGLGAWVLCATLLLSDIASAKAIYFPNVLKVRTDPEEAMRRAAFKFEGELERRSPSTTTTLPISTSNTTMNVTVAAACASAVATISTVSNAAGFAGCYNILEWDPSTALFQADLRLYQRSVASGNFTSLSANEITVVLNYPDSTQFKSLVKRSSTHLVVRDGGAVQIQQYSLAGNFKGQINVSKLNQTYLASLMVPQISLQAKSPTSQKSVTTNMTASDSAWFVAGQMTSVSADAAQVANPATASAAIIASTPFVLPGQTFGIFPTGLIVTSVWTLLFFVAYGLGTIGRAKSRNLYRRRITGLATRRRR